MIVHGNEGLARNIGVAAIGALATTYIPTLFLGTLGVNEAIYGPNMVGIWAGSAPDNRGIEYVNNTYASTGDSAIPIDVAAGIALQYQWNENALDRFLALISDSSSTGPAQIPQSEMDQWVKDGLWPADMDPNTPEGSAFAMSLRIDGAVAACKNRCSEADKLIIAAMAQNGTGFTTKNVKEIFIRNNGFLNPDGSINWNAYILSREPKTENWYRRLLSWRAGNQNFDTQFMLKLFTNDLEALHSQGWTLPEGVDADDLLYMECLANEIPAEAEFDAQNPKVYCVRP